MAAFEKFLSIDYLLSLFNSAENMLLTLIIVSMLTISIVLLLFLLSSERKRLVLRKQFSFQTKHLNAKLAQAEAVLASDEQLLLIWPNQASMMNGEKLNSETAREIGGLQNVIGLPKNVADILNFRNWIGQQGVNQTLAALKDLREDGKAFTFFVKTKAIERVEMSGYVVGREIVFRIRDLKEDRLFLARANEKWVGLESKVAQYDGLLNNNPMPTWMRDDEGNLTWVNEAYVAAVEAEDASNVVNDKIELIAPADVYKARQYFMDGDAEQTEPDKNDDFTKLEDGRIEQLVFAVIKGERCNLKIQHQKIDGGIVATALDMTKYERMKDELERYNHAHKQTLDKLKTAIAQFGPDQNLEFYNAAYQELFGMEMSFLDSKPSMSMVLEQIRNLKKMPEQSNFKSWRDGELDAFRQVESSEKWWHLPNGTNLHIIADPNPFGGVTFLYDDVTEHMALASKYNKLDQIQSETLDNLTDGVAVFNSDGELQISNPAFAKIWQFETDQLVNRPHVNKVLDWCEKQTKFADGGAGKNIWSILKTRVTAIVDDREEEVGRFVCENDIVVDFAAIPLPNSSTLMTFTDVTLVAKTSNLLTERNDALVAADQLKTDFISHVSYQFREPLTNILGFSEMLEEQVFGNLNPKQLEYVDFIRSSSLGLRALINDILDLASLDADRMELKIEQIQVVELINSAVEAVKMPVEQKNIILNRIVMPHIGSFAGDAERISQILYNLLSNAVHFSKDNSIVSIGAEKEKNHIRLWVRDAGVGISDEKLKTVFDEFSTDKPTGAGLGLTLVKKLVEFHGGEVKISSEVDKGTIVSCYFPLEQIETRKLPLNAVPAKAEIEMQVEKGSNLVELKPDQKVLPIVSAFLAADEAKPEPKPQEKTKLEVVPKVEPEPEPKAEPESEPKTEPKIELEAELKQEVKPEPKKMSTLEQLKMLRSKKQSNDAKARDVVDEKPAEEADKEVEELVKDASVEDVWDAQPKADAAEPKSDAKAGIMGNSRLAALYQRSAKKDNNDTDNDE